MNKKLICGIKATHDGAIALVQGNNLIFSIEVEKLNNNPRYSPIKDLNMVGTILNEYGFNLSMIDEFVVDGWEGLGHSKIKTQFNGIEVELPVAPYREQSLTQDISNKYYYHGLPLDYEKQYSYASFMHVMGHIASTYYTSPFSKRKEGSYVLVWDGGMFPRFYYVDPKDQTIQNYGKLFYIFGNFYSIFASHFQPFNKHVLSGKDDLSSAGKVMAYIANGVFRPDILIEFEYILNHNLDINLGYANHFATQFLKSNVAKKYSNADILRTMHHFLEKLLLENLERKLKKYGKGSKNLCIAGGCALNIKWNTKIRESDLFKEVWVPPFPNDAGSAIGAACAKLWKDTSLVELDWNSYCGPIVKDSVPLKNWYITQCSPEQLATILVKNDTPVVVINGLAEAGPRALGNRSIIAPAVNPSMKDLLNQIKGRENYRPVAPICLEDDAKQIFEPGIRDPYMIFENYIKPGWRKIIPAVCHIDGSARLQTVSFQDNAMIYRLLVAYKNLTGIPVLCNTSANYNGKGFFPDVKSVMEWGKIKIIWSNNNLYVHESMKYLIEKLNFLGPLEAVEHEKIKTISL